MSVEESSKTFIAKLLPSIASIVPREFVPANPSAPCKCRDAQERSPRDTTPSRTGRPSESTRRRSARKPRHHQGASRVAFANLVPVGFARRDRSSPSSLRLPCSCQRRHILWALYHAARQPPNSLAKSSRMTGPELRRRPGRTLRAAQDRAKQTGAVPLQPLHPARPGGSTTDRLERTPRNVAPASTGLVPMERTTGRLAGESPSHRDKPGGDEAASFAPPSWAVVVPPGRIRSRCCSVNLKVAILLCLS